MVNSAMPPPEPLWRITLRLLATIGFVGAGIKHFTNADFFQRIVPPGFGSPALLVAISGVCEIIGGLALWVPALRQAAGWGLIALLIAVFPANIYMAIHPEKFADLHWATWILWTRLPLQGVFIWWIWAVALK